LKVISGNVVIPASNILEIIFDTSIETKIANKETGWVEREGEGASWLGGWTPQTMVNDVAQ